MTRTPHSHHFLEFKEQALLKARHRGTRSVISIADELNMAAGTLRKWLQSASKKTGMTTSRMPATAALDSPASAWTPAQRLMALQQSYALDDAVRAGWCREHGVFEHQLAQWHQEFCTPTVSPASREAPGAFRDLQRQHEQLQRELRRKEKALAEVAALLVLQKNFKALLEGANT